MDGFSAVDGFVEITECLVEMIKYVANEPSVGLFYIQQHTQNAVPNLINLKGNVAAKTRDTILHTEDLEDSITMVKSMKECGFPIADEMIKDIKKSLVIMSIQDMERGLPHSSVSGSQMGRASSWGPASWGTSADTPARNGGDGTSYLSSVFKSAKEKASNIKWPQLDIPESIQRGGLSFPSIPLASQSSSSNSTMPETAAKDLPFSGLVGEEPPEGEDLQGDIDVPRDPLLSLSESYDDFKADKEAELEKWLEEETEKDDDLKGNRL